MGGIIPCIDYTFNGVNANILVGKTLIKAENYIRFNSVFNDGDKIQSLRVVYCDGQYFGGTKDSVPSRLDVYVKNNIIVVIS